MMVKEHLDSIREREGDAKKRIAEAGSEASRIVDQAKEEGEKLLEDTRIEGNELKRTMIASARENAQKKIGELRASNVETIDSLGKGAEGKRREVVDMIIEEFHKGL
ncbi:MAG: hypothetical protein KOO63_01915 [Bacteroidales bacterium]|nr:hypothetical protein [Candidatus Latescibacterota bacterium]